MLRIGIDIPVSQCIKRWSNRYIVTALPQAAIDNDAHICIVEVRVFPVKKCARAGNKFTGFIIPRHLKHRPRAVTQTGQDPIIPRLRGYNRPRVTAANISAYCGYGVGINKVELDIRIQETALLRPYGGCENRVVSDDLPVDSKTGKARGILRLPGDLCRPVLIALWLSGDTCNDGSCRCDRLRRA
jgi:hypothetical protein